MINWFNFFRTHKTPVIIPHLGYGDNEDVIFIARVLWDFKELEKISKEMNLTRWQNFKRFWNRYNVKPARSFEVTVEYQDQVKKFTSSSSGLIEARFSTSCDNFEGEHEAIARISDSDEGIKLKAIIDTRDNQYGIISDIDDTILIANAWNKWKMVQLVLFYNFFTRKAFDKAAELYQALVKGGDNKSSNPIFYVSSSHWNLYDFLSNFIQQSGFPEGPLLLKQNDGWLSIIKNLNQHGHKKEKIINILKTYQDLQFILIGDTTQKDAEIYVDIALEFPGRIKHIFIRDVAKFSNQRVKRALAKARQHKIDQHITIEKDSIHLMRRAKALGLTI